MKITANFSGKTAFKLILDKVNSIILCLFVVLILFLLYFCYVNIYKTLIKPDEIKSSEIIAKKQKINLELFSEIRANIEKKENLAKNAFRVIKNPF